MNSEIAADVTIHGHRQLLGQALANLLENAIKYSAPGGRIALTLAASAKGVVLCVADNGPGIPQELQRFVRLDDSRGTPGSGLGLSLVAAVAKLHDVKLELGDNRPGLKVTLTFPQA